MNIVRTFEIKNFVANIDKPQTVHIPKESKILGFLDQEIPLIVCEVDGNQHEEEELTFIIIREGQPIPSNYKYISSQKNRDGHLFQILD